MARVTGAVFAIAFAEYRLGKRGPGSWGEAGAEGQVCSGGAKHTQNLTS
jgi:hypothetical protein